jgi:hypothetical protein
MRQSTVAGNSAQTSHSLLYMRPARLEGGTCCSAVQSAYFSLGTGARQHTNPAKLCNKTYITYITIIKAHTGTARGGGGTLARLQGPERFFIMGSASFFTAPPPG